jgi:hypothetical protein
VNSFNIGNEFKTSQTLYVSKMGAFIAPVQISGGLTTKAYTSTLYSDNNTTVLASATIPVGTAVDAQGFAYVPLTYVLAPSTNYVLTSYGGPSQSAYSYGSTGTWNLGTTFIQNWYNASGAGPAFQTNSGHVQFMGGNFIVDNVPPPAAPEPTTAWLIGLGVLAMTKTIRSQKRRKAQLN